MNSTIKIKLLFLALCFINVTSYCAIPSTEIDTSRESLATKPECNQWKKNITSNEGTIQKLENKLKNAVDQASRGKLQTKIKAIQHKLVPLEDNYTKECKKFEK